MKVEDTVTGDYEVDFVNRNSGSDDYSYYANGALKADKNEAINDIIYSTYVNQPIEIQLTNNRWIKNFYDGSGRLYKTSYSTGEYWEYLDGLVFKNGAFYQLATPEGRAVYQSGAWSYEYFHTDHLGNTRVSYKANGTALSKTSETSFDPWGVVLRDGGLVNTFQNRFEYQNKEKESTFNLRRIDFGARSYNASIGRFDRVDPLANHPFQLYYSPYSSLNNNPINNIDSDGKIPLPLITGAIGAAGGLIYGLATGKSWKQTAALTIGGFVTGATLGLGGTAIAAAGGIEALGGAGVSYITLASGVAGGIIGNAAEQGVKVALNEGSKFSGQEVVLNGAFGMSEVVLGPAGEIVGNMAKNSIKEGLSGMFKQASLGNSLI